jgi:hypothetical protein
MTIKEKLIEIVGDNAEVINRGRFSSGDDINNCWYECFDVRKNENYNDEHFNELCNQIKSKFSKRRIEYSLIYKSFSIHIENSLLLQRKEKLENLKNYE